MPKKRPAEDNAAVRSRFGRHLAAAIDKDGRSKSEIAAAVGIGASSISDYIAGRTQPGLVTLVLLAHELREPVSFLVGDRLRGKASAEQAGRNLVSMIGYHRARLLLEIEPQALIDELDRLIGRHAVQGARKRAKSS